MPLHVSNDQPELGPPRKRQPPAAAKGKQPAKPRRSKLAQENDITAEDEAEIKAAWRMFQVEETPDKFADEKEGVIRTEDVRRAMKAQGIAPRSAKELASFIDTLDSDGEGYVTYANFLAICAIKLSERTDESKLEEVEAAYRLFTKGTNGPINILHLKRVAKELREEISDEVLRNMILEANGGAGVNRGVGLEDFQAVMTRAGVFQ